MQLFPHLINYVADRRAEAKTIPAMRRRILSDLATYIRTLNTQGTPIRIVFICTHNSRRSHFAQVWAQTAAAHFGIVGVDCFSAGTEVTACNLRTVAALERVGFNVHVRAGHGDNPRYVIRYAESAPPLLCFSKLIAGAIDPSSEFAAVMTCAAADANCPLVPGANTRFTITYDDPKFADQSPQELTTYDACCRQIAREMLYCFSVVS